MTQRLVEMLAGIKIIRAFGGEERERAAFEQETERFFRRSMRVVRNRMAARSLVEMLNSAIGIGIVVGGAWVVASGWSGLTAGDLAAFSAVLASTYKPLKDVARAWVRIICSWVPVSSRNTKALGGMVRTAARKSCRNRLTRSVCASAKRIVFFFV